MGICGSSPAMSAAEARELKSARSKSRSVDDQLERDRSEDEHVAKLLLLGAGESGKSTLFKQMITLYGSGWKEEERLQFKDAVDDNIISSMKVLCHHSADYEPVEAKAVDSKNYILDEVKKGEVIDEALAEHIKILWADSGIQTTYDNRSSFQLIDSAAYFFNKVDEVAKEGYIPSEQDILRCRVRTTGIVENAFVIEKNNFKMFDVGGQRNERKKWIHCFENVTAVLFVAAISAYDQVLYEDDTTNRLHEALNLFDEICNSRWFRNTDMILFLNKRDLFADKIAKVPLTKCFPDYTGPNTYDEASQFIREQFVSKNKNSDKRIYYHITCATDTGNVRKVFDDIRSTVINKSLKDLGIM